MMIVYMGKYKPYSDRRDNQLETSNEFSVLWVLALCLGFTSPTIEGPMRSAMGALAIAIVFITLLINAAMILYQLARDIYLWALRIYNYKLG